MQKWKRREQGHALWVKQIRLLCQGTELEDWPHTHTTHGWGFVFYFIPDQQIIGRPWLLGLWLFWGVWFHIYGIMIGKEGWHIPPFQFSSVAQSCPTLCDPMNPSMPGLSVHHQLWSLLKLMSIESVMPSNHLILCRPLLLLPPIPPSIRVFSNESVLPIRWPKYWSFSFNISPSNEYSGLISFGMDWLDLLAAQGTLKSLLQHHSSKASILRHSAFFIVQLSHPYMTTEKNHSFD